jgi:S-adenosylmethionine hydrolase
MAGKHIIALITDFGDRGHFVGVMKGVILNLDQDIKIVDISHNIEPQNILEAIFTLKDTIQYFPENTIFVIVVDPGVGLNRKSLAVRAKSGQVIICPDNGILTEVKREPGLESVRLISETMNRLPGSEIFHTFHGRDIYAYTAGRLAAGLVSFESIGTRVKERIIELPIRKAEIKYRAIEGAIVKIEHPFGNICTNIPSSLVEEMEITSGDKLQFEIFESDGLIHEGMFPFVQTFGEVKQKSPLAYIDSSGRLGLAINMGNFAHEYKVRSGMTWWLRAFRKML